MSEIDRKSTEQFGISSLSLMENAAAATAQFVIESCGGNMTGKAVLVLCGKGNNGGDGTACARLLADAGARVDVVLIGTQDKVYGDARVNLDRFNRISRADAEPDEPRTTSLECESQDQWKHLLTTQVLAPHDVTIDALFGTGLSRPLSGMYRDIVRYLLKLREAPNGATSPPSYLVSIDLPSGLNADSEHIIGETVRAHATITMTAPKPANVLPPASDYNGNLIVADIGSPDELISQFPTNLFLAESADARSWLTQTRYVPGSHKNTHGHVLVIAGSRGFTGAAALCGNAAMSAGAGLVTVGTPASVQPLVATQVMPEVMTTALAETDRGAVSEEAVDYALRIAARADVVAVGPGLSSEDDRTGKFVRAIVERRQRLVIIDADGLNCLAPWPSDLRGSDEYPVVLTPHPGEMMRLLGVKDKDAVTDRVSVAREFATAYQLILVLKGTRTLIAAPDGRVVVNPTGNAGLGTAGAGDTLTGVIAAFLAQAYATLKHQADAFQSVVSAVYVSGLAGDLAARRIGMRAMTASDIREHLSAAFILLDPVGELPSGKSIGSLTE
jgi:NAD(P)H-hydrate epimerase